MPDDPHVAPSAAVAEALGVVHAYHARSKHRLERYAAGPETLDWSAQPDPFRTYTGAGVQLLPLGADALASRWQAVHRPGAIPPQPLNADTLGTLLELTLGLAAWKQAGPDRWAVRCNPSSGNLHPTEGYVLAQGLPGLADGLWHYRPREHALEQRCAWPAPAVSSPRLYVGFSAVLWRELWKYGERAFRYCQLDAGHALGALAYAAAALGWHLRPVSIGHEALAALLGLDRDADFGKAEREEPELLVEVLAGGAASHTLPVIPPDAVWHGQANVLDRWPMYRWPVVDEVARASRRPAGVSEHASPADAALPPLQPAATEVRAATLIRARRSAQRFVRDAQQDLASFLRLLDALLPRTGLPPWSGLNAPVRVHPLLFVHRVEGLAAGVYVLPRSASAVTTLRPALSEGFSWDKPEGVPAHLPLYRLADGTTAKITRTLSCHQALAADCTFTLALLAEFDATLAAAPWAYRELHHEAGLIAQALYLHAEAEGLRGTGIGCFFDDAVHALLGLADARFQSLYHFTVGRPQPDARIASEPPYPDRR